MLSIRIDAHGQAQDAKVIRSPSAEFSRRAIEYVLKCVRYRPGSAEHEVEVIFRVL